MVRHVAIEDVRRELEGGKPFRLVDVRTPGEFRRLHARGAISLPLGQLDPARLSEVPGDGPIYVICQSGARAARACEQLEPSRTDVASIEGGTEAWERAGLPVERTEGGSISIERQVRIVAGALIATTAVLGHFVHPGFLIATVGIGAGLMYAGITGSCAMGMVLMGMPWNRA